MTFHEWWGKQLPNTYLAPIKEIAERAWEAGNRAGYKEGYDNGYNDSYDDVSGCLA